MDLQTRILESLSLIGQFVTIEELRQRGNIPKTPDVVQCALDALVRAKKVQVFGNQYGLADWASPDTRPESRRTSTGRSGQKAKDGETRQRVGELVTEGFGIVAIANKLGIAVSTASLHAKSIREESDRTLVTMLNTPPAPKNSKSSKPHQPAAVKPPHKPTEPPCTVESKVVSNTHSSKPAESHERQPGEALEGSLGTIPVDNSPVKPIIQLEQIEQQIREDEAMAYQSPPHKALLDLERMAAKSEQVIEDAETKIAFLNKIAQNLLADGYQDAGHFALLIREDIENISTEQMKAA